MASSFSSLPSLALPSADFSTPIVSSSTLSRHRIGVAVLAAMREREARRIGEAVRRAVHHLGDQRQRMHRARADARHQQQVGEVGRAGIGRGGERAVQAAHDHVLGPHVVMLRHDQMRQQRLRPRRAPVVPLQRASSLHDAVGTEFLQQLELARARGAWRARR